MKLRRIETAREFLDVATDFLSQKEAENNLLLGLSSSILTGKSRYTDVYWSVLEDEHGEVIGAAMRTIPKNLLISYPYPDAAFDLLVNDAYDLWGDTLAGVQADTEAAHNFAQKWSACSGKSASDGMKERIYYIDTVIPVSGVAGHLRPLEDRDRETAYRWLEEFIIEAMGETPQPDHINRLLDEALDPETPRYYAVWEVDGEIVSLVGCSGFTPNGAKIGPVHTPKEKRRRGYASAATAAFSQQFFDSGKKYCFLYTDLANPTSNHIYQVIGYRPVVDVDVIEFI